jgi:ABC-2 type transport system ATP-binding protein
VSEGDQQGARVVARGLSRRFGAFEALRPLDLEIAPGEVFGLLGANGAGKTTLIRLITGYLLPSSGAVTVDGRSPGQDARAVQSRLGYVPETPRLYGELRVTGVLRFVAGLLGLSGAARRSAGVAAIARFRLEDVARRPIGHLSKGYRQRVSLAQAFLHDPSLVIVDEPTSGLDPLQRREVREALSRLGGRRTVVLCTHDLAEARALTTRCAVLHGGALVAAGATESVLGGDEPLALFRGRVPEAAS